MITRASFTETGLIETFLGKSYPFIDPDDAITHLINAGLNLATSSGNLKKSIEKVERSLRRERKYHMLNGIDLCLAEIFCSSYILENIQLREDEYSFRTLRLGGLELLLAKKIPDDEQRMHAVDIALSTLKKTESKNKKLLLRQAECYMLLGDYDNAIELLERARSPEVEETVRTGFLAQCSYRIKDYEGAVKYGMISRKEGNTHPQNTKVVAESLFKLGFHEASYSYLVEVIEKGKGNECTYAFTARCAAEASDYKKMLLFFEKSVSLARNAPKCTARIIDSQLTQSFLLFSASHQGISAKSHIEILSKFCDIYQGFARAVACHDNFYLGLKDELSIYNFRV